MEYISFLGTQKKHRDDHLILDGVKVVGSLDEGHVVCGLGSALCLVGEGSAEEYPQLVAVLGSVSGMLL